MLNILLEDVVQGHPVTEQRLKEVLGHTPLQVGFAVVQGLSILRAHTVFQPYLVLLTGHCRGICGRPHWLLHASPLCCRALTVHSEPAAPWRLYSYPLFGRPARDWLYSAF